MVYIYRCSVLLLNYSWYENIFDIVVVSFAPLRKPVIYIFSFTIIAQTF